MKMRTLRRTTAVLAAAALMLTACGSDDGDDPGGSDSGSDSGTEAPTDEMSDDPSDAMSDDGTAAGDVTTITEGVLTVCSDIPYPPFEFEAADGSFTGFDIDLVSAVATEIGLELEVIATGFEGIQSGTSLAAGQCDLAVSAMTITEDREENLDFTEPYFQADQSLLVVADSGITTLADVAGMNIGVQSETTGAAYAEENAPEDTTFTEFSSGADAITALQAGQVQAVLQDLGPNQDAADNDETLTVAETYPTEETYGFAVAEEGSDALLDAVNQALATLMDNGTYDEIFGEYFPTAEPAF